MKRIQVPPAMLEAALSDHPWKDAGYPVAVERALTAALRWLLEGNRLPLPSITNERYQGPEWSTGWNLGVDAVRRMFLAPEPEVPEAIGDLINQPWGAGVQKAILEAYKRGKAGK